MTLFASVCFEQVMFSKNSSVAAHVSGVEDELNHLTSDLSALLQQVFMVCSVEASLHHENKHSFNV